MTRPIDTPRRLATAGLAILSAFATATGASAQEAGDPGRGLAYARTVCAGCHGVERADRFSPRVGIATFKVIANTPGMTGTALSVWLRTPHPTMPNIVIEPDDRNSVIAYIVSLRDAPAGK